jgi:hypothetical protein
MKKGRPYWPPLTVLLVDRVGGFDMDDYPTQVWRVFTQSPLYLFG